MAKDKNEADKNKTAVAVAPTTAGAVAVATDYGADAGQGFEGQSRSDISIPLLGVLQAMSPQVTNMQAAKPGMLFNTVTEELIPGSEGVVLVPATTRHQFVEWVPREKGGGYVAAHEPGSEVVKAAQAASKDFGKLTLPNGNQLVETFYIYGMVLDADKQPTQMITVPLTSVKISPYKRWNTKVNMFTVKTPTGQKVRPPLFAHTLRITTVKEKNLKGEYFNVDLQPAVNNSVAESLLPPGHPALEAAKELRDMVSQGVAKGAYETEAAPGGGSGATNPDWNT
jgi:hypothetical protein